MRHTEQCATDDDARWCRECKARQELREDGYDFGYSAADLAGLADGAAADEWAGRGA